MTCPGRLRQHATRNGVLGGGNRLWGEKSFAGIPPGGQPVVRTTYPPNIIVRLGLCYVFMEEVFIKS